jgi:hypothetical protein
MSKSHSSEADLYLAVLLLLIPNQGDSYFVCAFVASRLLLLHLWRYRGLLGLVHSRNSAWRIQDFLKPGSGDGRKLVNA